jgi:hypothetical protein
VLTAVAALATACDQQRADAAAAQQSGRELPDLFAQLPEHARRELLDDFAATFPPSSRPTISYPKRPRRNGGV